MELEGQKERKSGNIAFCVQERERESERARERERQPDRDVQSVCGVRRTEREKERYIAF